MRTLEYTDSAEADLAGIVQDTIDRWGADQANRYIDGLERLTSRLVEHPAIGTTCEDLDGMPQAFPYQSHILYYLVEPDRLVVLRVLHKRMNPRLHLPVAGGAE